MSCVLNEMPLAERDFWILLRRMKMDARWERSPSSRKMFIVASDERARSALGEEDGRRRGGRCEDDGTWGEEASESVGRVWRVGVSSS